MFVLGHSKTKDAKNDASFARIRTIILISVFLQLVCVASSFQEGVTIGGACREGALITFLFDVVYGLGFLVMFWYQMEKFFGFGKKKTIIEEVDGQKVTREVKEFYLATEDQKTSEVMFKNMSFYLGIFTPLLAMIKLGLLLFGRLFIVKQLDKPLLACNFYEDTLYAIDQMGLLYFGLFAL